MLLRIISFPILIAGIIYGIAIIYSAYRNKAQVCAEQGSFAALGPLEVIIYFFAASGISDFLLNTLMIKKLKLMEDDKLPGTLVACCLVPSAIFSFSLLHKGAAIDPVSLLSCAAAIAIGSYIGSLMAGKFDGKSIKKIMVFALAASFAILVVKIIITRGAAGELTSLTGIKLIIAVVICFITGLINMFGIPMKPTWTALFLILGLSPISTLTMVLSVGYFGPLTGGINVIRSGNYHKKTALAASTFGALGAVIGVLLAVSISQGVLNIVLLLVMALAIFTMLRSK